MEAGSLACLSADFEGVDALLQVPLPATGLAIEEIGPPQTGEDVGSAAAVLHVVDDPLVKHCGVGVSLVRLRLLGGFDRHRNRLIPASSRHQVVSELMLVELRLLA